MGKINKRDSNTVPVNGSKSRLSGRKPKKKLSTFFSDPLLVPRINKYLADHKDKVYIDVNDMVNELQAQYREYGRRKRTAFKPLVQQAFSSIVDDCDTSRPAKRKKGEALGDSSDSSSSDTEVRRRKLSSNSQLMRLYGTKVTPKCQTAPVNSNGSSAELIDLSSGDECKKAAAIRDKLIADGLRQFREEMNRRAHSLYTAGPAPGPSRPRPNLFVPHRSGRDLFPRTFPRTLKRKKNQNGKKITFADFGGDERVLEEVCKLILHIPHPEIYREVGVTAPCGVLLHGPPGCGKTLLARAIAGEMDVELFQVSAPELIGGVSGESEERIRDLFDKAYRNVPCVLFIDEVDAITPNRELAQKEMERRIVAQLLTCLDELSTKPDGDQVLVIGATNRPDSLDPALRRAGRFDREVCLGIPDVRTRERILKVLCSKMNLAENFSYEELAQMTPGFVGADLLSLTREAALVALNRILGALEAFRNQEEQRNKRRRIDTEDDSEPEEVVIESSQSDEALPPELAQNELMLRQAEEAISQNIANEQHSLQTRQGLADDGEPVAGPSSRMDTDVEVSEIDLIEAQAERAASENIANEIIEQDNLANEEGVAVIDVEGGRSEETRSPQQEESNEERNEIEIEVEAEAEAEAGAEGGDENEDDDDDEEEDDEEDEIEANDMPTLETLISWLHDPTPLTCRQLRDVCITQEDFRRALRSVQPSAKREGFATVPDVTWEDIGSLADVREELKMSILGPVRFRRQFESLGLRGPAGILICGPPGCGKTLLAKAVANEAGINFISVKGPELLNMYVGESERAVRRCFQRARNSAPCVIFFDELDALCPRRSDVSENGASKRVVNQLLTEMDGVEDRKEVYLMAATNRPDIVDPAVLRPGRLDKVIYVGLPEPDDRVDILRAVTRTRPRLDPDVNLEEIARRPECTGYSGADLAALVREAGIQAVKDYMAMPPEEQPDDDSISVGVEHFERALQKVRPSVSPEDRVYYETMKLKYQTRRN